MEYRHFIDPRHPLVRAVFGDPPRERAAVMPHALDMLRARCRYTPGPPGRRSFDQLHEQWREAQAAGLPLPLNCLNQACLLTSHLRASGIDRDDIFALVITARGVRLDCNVVHAGVIVRAGSGQWLWIDPARPQPAPLTGAEFLARYVPAVIFNDRAVFFHDADKRHLLVAESRRGMRLYLYGHTDHSTRALIHDRVVGRAIRRVIVEGAARAEDEINVLTAACAAGLLRAAGNGYTAGPRLVPVTAEAEESFRATVEPALDRYVAIVQSGIGTLRETYATTRPASRFTWDDVAHTVVAAMLMDLSVGQHLGLADEVDKRHGGAVVWAFERVSADNAYGVVWTPDPSCAGGFGQMWHTTVARAPMRLAPAIAATLVRVATGPQATADPKALLYLSHLKLVQRSAGSSALYDVAVPAFDADDARRLMDVINPLAEILVRETLMPSIACVSQHPSWRSESGTESTHAAVRLLLEYAIDRVVRSGLLRPFPAGTEVPLAWGRWVWREPPGTRRLTPPMFEEAAEGAAVAG